MTQTVKKIAGSKFFQVIFFAGLGTLLQVLAFWGVRKVATDTFNAINFGIYAITLMTVLADALYRWLLIKLSHKDTINSTQELFAMITKTLLPAAIVILVIAGLLIVADSQSWLIVVLATIVSLITLAYYYPRALLIVKGRFILVGILDLALTVGRVIAVFFVLRNDNPWVVFALMAIVALIGAAIAFGQLSEKYDLEWKKALGHLVDFGNIKSILGNATLQIMIGIFWIADGVILKFLLSPDAYRQYIIYAYLYKLPLFVSVSLISILLSSKAKSIVKTFVVSMVLIGGIFGTVLAMEYVFPGFLLKILGYTLTDKKLSIVFGLAWLVQTWNFFMFSLIVKNTKRIKLIATMAVLYSTSYLAILWANYKDIPSMMKYILIHGAIFAGINLLFLLRDRQKN